jgi:predicted permease
MLIQVWQDVRYGARQLRQNPGFAAVAILSLALGIGANTAIFQLINAVRLRTLPVRHPEELADINFQKGSFRSGNSSTRSARLTYGQWDEIRTRQQAFSGMFAWSAAGFNLATGGQARHAEGLFVSPSFFPVLGVSPILGRTFTSEEEGPACSSPGAVIGHSFWQREFAGNPDAIGRTVSLDGRTFPVIGVTGPDFFGVEVGHRYEVAVPLCADPLFAAGGKGRIPGKLDYWLSAMGRLKPGWTLERARAHIQTLSPGIMEATVAPSYRPEEASQYLKNRLDVATGAAGVSQLRRAYQTPLWLLLATTGLVLLIACANLANLLLARASVRQREMAVRQAIGASRGRLLAQLLAESMLISAAGTALGAGLAQALSQALIAFLNTPGNPVFVGMQPDLRMLAFTAAIAVITCLLFGLLPALRATRVAPASAMRAGGRGLTLGRERFSLRRSLVVAQVSLSLVLLVGALLFARSLQKLLAVDAGFRAEQLTVLNVDLRPAHYSKDRLPLIHRNLVDQIRAVPGVVAASETLLAPISNGGWDENTWAEGSTGKHLDCYFNSVGSGYFRTMATPFVSGRDFDDRDTSGSARVAIVNQEFARTVFGAANPLGRQFRVEGPAGQPDPSYQVVGVVRNAKYYEIREDFLPVAFFPLTQDPHVGPYAVFMIRTAMLRGDAARAFTSLLAGVHPGIGIQLTDFAEQIRSSLLRDRLMAILAGAFGLLAASLATLGLYGVIAYTVARRRNEIGVRVALGADRGTVVRLVLREAVLLVAAGIVIGSALALWAGQAAASLLFNLKPYDPVTLVSATLLLAVVALVASYAPARRAARLEPMLALREE